MSVFFAHRLVKAKWTEAAFSGEGARRYGGRWNSVGVPIVYAAGSLALAQLEILVNLPTDRLLGSYVAFRIQVPEECAEVLSLGDLPPSWRSDPAPQATKDIGDVWTQSGRSLVLEVPSAVVPSERSYLINPQQKDFERLQIDGPFDPSIDARLS